MCIDNGVSTTNPHAYWSLYPLSYLTKTRCTQFDSCSDKSEDKYNYQARNYIYLKDHVNNKLFEYANSLVDKLSNNKRNILMIAIALKTNTNKTVN